MDLRTALAEGLKALARGALRDGLLPPFRISGTDANGVNLEESNLELATLPFTLKLEARDGRTASVTIEPEPPAKHSLN